MGILQDIYGVSSKILYWQCSYFKLWRFEGNKVCGFEGGSRGSPSRLWARGLWRFALIFISTLEIRHKLEFVYFNGIIYYILAELFNQ